MDYRTVTDNAMHERGRAVTDRWAREARAFAGGCTGIPSRRAAWRGLFYQLEQGLGTGYPLFGLRAIRVDIAEKTNRSLAGATRRSTPFDVPDRVARWISDTTEDLALAVEALAIPLIRRRPLRRAFHQESAQFLCTVVDVSMCHSHTC